MNNSPEKQHQLDVLKADILANNVTPNLAAQATHLVMGHGNLDSEFFFIGEAPGKNEDLTGKPFQGGAGQLLNELLESVDIERDDVYVTNIVKYRPPKNRDPSRAEKDESWPYLERELSIIRPKVILTLGRHSMGHFLSDVTIGEVHGSLYDVTVAGEQYTLAPLYHPSSTIYNKQTRQHFFDDLPKVIEAIKQKTQQ